LISIKLEAR